MAPPSGRVVERRHEQLQLFEGAAMTTDLRRLVLHDVAQVLQLLAAHSALLVSGSTKTSEAQMQRTKTSASLSN